MFGGECPSSAQRTAVDFKGESHLYNNMKSLVNFIGYLWYFPCIKCTMCNRFELEELYKNQH